MLIYFAGHGFVPRARATSRLRFRARPRRRHRLPHGELGSVIGGKIKAKSKILLTDACHSGAITPEDTEDLNNRFGDLARASSPSPPAAIANNHSKSQIWGGHGVFTYYVVQGLEGAADTLRRRRRHRR